MTLPTAATRWRWLLLACAATAAVLLAAVVVLHTWAPSWWPQPVLRHAPSADMALRAAARLVPGPGLPLEPPAELRRFPAAAFAALAVADDPRGHRAMWALCGRALPAAGGGRQDDAADAEIARAVADRDPLRRWLFATHAVGGEPVQAGHLIALLADEDPRVAAAALGALRWPTGFVARRRPWTEALAALAAAFARPLPAAAAASEAASPLPDALVLARPDLAWIAGRSRDRGQPAFAAQDAASAALRLRVGALVALLRLDTAAALAAWQRSAGDEPERRAVLAAAVGAAGVDLPMSLAQLAADGGVPQAAESVAEALAALARPAQDGSPARSGAATLALARLACAQGPAGAAALRLLRGLEDQLAGDPQIGQLAAAARDTFLWEPRLGQPLAVLMRAEARRTAAPDAAALVLLGNQLAETHAGLRLAAAAALGIHARRGDARARALLERRARSEGDAAVRAEIAAGLAAPAPGGGRTP